MGAFRLSEATNLDVVQKLYMLLGYCPIERKVLGGLLAEGTMVQIHDQIVSLLIQQGIDRRKSEKIVNSALRECNSGNLGRTTKELRDLRKLFKALKNSGVKIAICTADNR